MLEPPYRLKIVGKLRLLFPSKKFLALANQQETSTKRCPLGPKLFYSTLEGSPETKRERNFDFSSYRALCVSCNLPVPDQDFLTWFVGFSEGDGSWMTSKDRAFFFLVQKEVAPLHRIQGTLGFGSISRHGSYFRYTVSSKKHLTYLVVLFTGNLVLDRTNLRFVKFRSVVGYENVAPSPIDLRSHLWHSSWLSGFTDAEGCFNIRFQNDSRRSTGTRLRLRFLLYQKESEAFFLQLKNVFGGGSVYSRSKDSNQTVFCVDTFRLVPKIVAYFKKFPLRTAKTFDFSRWRSVWFLVEDGKHLTEQGMANIKKIARRIEKRQNSKI